jgi:(5-formylfuran-3-yl)methyl phosphate synthase
VARLLVSVRSADEARRAAHAGAAIIDVKEPDRGSLGRADCSVWQEVRSTLPPAIALSVALGELTEWFQPNPPNVPAGAWAGISFRKLGLAGAGSHWRRDWRELRSRTEVEESPPWIAVVYADWQSVAAPDPDAVLEVASESPEVVGILIDTYAKAGPFRIDARWLAWAEKLRHAGLMLAVAGGLDRQSIPTLAGLAPDIVAVRSAACVGGQRGAAIAPHRVAKLAQAVAALPENAQSVPANSHARHKATSNLSPREAVRGPGEP